MQLKSLIEAHVVSSPNHERAFTCMKKQTCMSYSDLFFSFKSIFAMFGSLQSPKARERKWISHWPPWKKKILEVKLYAIALLPLSIWQTLILLLIWWRKKLEATKALVFWRNGTNIYHCFGSWFHPVKKTPQRLAWTMRKQLLGRWPCNLHRIAEFDDNSTLYRSDTKVIDFINCWTEQCINTMRRVDNKSLTIGED